jgi:hypothetical protein
VAIVYSALKVEIVSDPQTYGYAAFVTAGEPENVAAALNKIRNGTDGELAISINRAAIAPMELMEAIDIRDLNIGGQLNATLCGSWLESALQSVAPLRLRDAAGAKTRVRQNIDRILNDTNGSQTRFDAVAIRFGSRAEQLFGEGTVITGADVATALRT